MLLKTDVREAVLFNKQSEGTKQKVSVFIKRACSAITNGNYAVSRTLESTHELEHRSLIKDLWLEVRNLIMPRLSLDARKKVVLLHNSGLSVRKIKTRLSEENVDITRRSLYRLIKKFRKPTSIWICIVENERRKSHKRWPL